MFAQSVVSKGGRVVVSACLVRVVLRGVNRLSAERHNAAMYARLRGGFAGYLVTDENPCDMTAAEMAACWPFDDREPVRFSDSRMEYAPRRVAVMVTGFEYHGLGNSLDAPDFMHAGAMTFIKGFGVFPVHAERGK